MWLVLLQPGRFFKSLYAGEDARQWVWMALVVLVLVGVSAARGNNISSSTVEPGGETPLDGGYLPGDPFADPAFSGEMLDGGQGILVGGGAATGTKAESSDGWTTALIASSNIIVAWVLLVVLLALASLERGTAPRLSQNVQVAVWSSVPLGLMAALQFVYYLADGTPGAPGLAGLLPEWDRYAELGHAQQSLVLSVATRTTLFALWTLGLVYIGARHALRGRVWVALLVVLLWAMLIVVIPVTVGTIEAPVEATNPISPAEFPPDGEFFPGDDMLAPEFDGDAADDTSSATTDDVPESSMSIESEHPVPINSLKSRTGITR